MSLWEKILKTQMEIKPLRKEGQNIAQNYKFLTEDQVAREVLSKANANGLVITSSVVSSEVGVKTYVSYDKYLKGEVTKSLKYAQVKTEHKIVDSEDGTFDIVCGAGYAEDTSDKPLTKAITSANKYFLMKYFMIPTGDDIEHDQPEDQDNPAPPSQTPESEAERKKALNDASTLYARSKISQEEFQRVTGLSTFHGATTESLKKAYNDLNTYLEDKKKEFEANGY